MIDLFMHLTILFDISFDKDRGTVLLSRNKSSSLVFNSIEKN